MIEVLVVRGESQPVHYEFQQDEIVIGRRSGNDLVLPESSVSSRHARMFLDFDKVWLEDLNSTNGTLLNAREISRAHTVTREDVIEIGDFNIRLVAAVVQSKWRQMLEGDTSGPPTIVPEAGAVQAQVDLRATMYRRSSPVARPALVSSDAAYRPSTPLVPEVEIACESTRVSDVLDEDVEGRTELNLSDVSSMLEGKSAPVYFPPIPTSIEETGIKRSILVDLVLKTAYLSGEISGYDLAADTRLPFGPIIEPIIQELRRDKYLDVKGGGGSFGAISMVYTVTNKAADLIRQILDRNRYTGPAPVSMMDYVQLVEAQSIRRRKMPKRRMVREFGHLVLEDDIFDGIGPAMNSGMAILFHGPPGNGKSAICQAMINCYDDYVFVPYAIEVDGNIIKVFDEHNHRRAALEGEASETQTYDTRYVLCQRPLIMVGGELTLDMLDMTYSPEARFYEAPIQLKANGGILLIDDFGRQKASPRELLNRWIVPLESEIDFISLITGKKLRIPFDVFMVFATNLEPESLVDDAFLRRVRYKLEVGRPTAEQFKKIFQMVCGVCGIPWKEEGFQYLLSLYEKDERPINACAPRNLLEAIRSLGEYFEKEPVLSPELIDRAYRSYFTHTTIKHA